MTKGKENKLRQQKDIQRLVESNETLPQGKQSHRC